VSQYKKGLNLPTNKLVIFMLAMVTVTIVMIVLGQGISNQADNAITALAN
jgi:hypothetical protein